MKRIIFANQLVKKEKLSKKDFEIIIKSGRKGIFTKIKGENLPTKSSLIKIYATTISGARRIIFLFDESIDIAYFLFFRKKDDVIGQNISIKNPKFKKALYQYLNILDTDIENDNFKIKYTK